MIPLRMLTRGPSLLLLCLALFAWPVPSRAQVDADQRDEFQIKASLICVFIRYTEWPLRKFTQPGSPIILGVYGYSPVIEYLHENLADARMHGRSVVVKRISLREEVGGCHLVFISQTERSRTSSILAEARRENVLTIGETDDFLKSGGIIQFYKPSGGGVKYLVNAANAKRETLTLKGPLIYNGRPQTAVAETKGRSQQEIARRIAEAAKRAMENQVINED